MSCLTYLATEGSLQWTDALVSHFVFGRDCRFDGICVGLSFSRWRAGRQSHATRVDNSRCDLGWPVCFLDGQLQIRTDWPWRRRQVAREITAPINAKAAIGRLLFWAYFVSDYIM